MAAPSKLSKLPIEIRREIWGHLSDARVIEIRWDWKGGYYTLCKNPLPFRINHESRAFALSKYSLLEIENNLDMDDYEADNYSETSISNMEFSDDDDEEEADSQDPSPSTAQEPNEITDITNIEPAPVPMFRTYINYSKDIVYLAPEHMGCRDTYTINGPTTRVPALTCLLERFSHLPSISSNLQTLAIEASRLIHIKPFHLANTLFQLKNLSKIILVYGDDCCAANVSSPCRRDPDPDLEEAVDRENTVGYYEKEVEELRAELESSIRMYHRVKDIDGQLEAWKDLKFEPKLINRDRK
jgi:hypothetical protein